MCIEKQNKKKVEEMNLDELVEAVEETGNPDAGFRLLKYYMVHRHDRILSSQEKQELLSIVIFCKGYVGAAAAHYLLDYSDITSEELGSIMEYVTENTLREKALQKFYQTHIGGGHSLHTIAEAIITHTHFKGDAAHDEQGYYLEDEFMHTHFPEKTDALNETELLEICFSCMRLVCNNISSGLHNFAWALLLKYVPLFSKESQVTEWLEIIKDTSFDSTSKLDTQRRVANSSKLKVLGQ